jgi:hypothetical protein
MASLRWRIYRTRKKYRKLDLMYRIQNRGPKMENYTLGYEEICEIIFQNSGSVIHVDYPNRSKKWLHAWYFVTKSQATES